MSDIPVPKIQGGRSSGWLRAHGVLILGAALWLAVSIDVSALRAERASPARLADDDCLIGAVWLATGLVSTVVHEFGHLVAAFVLRLRPLEVAVLGVRIRFEKGRGPIPKRLRSYVRVAPGLSEPLLAVRLVGFSLAGPGANLCTAAFCYLMGERTGLKPLEHACWLVAAVVGAAWGVTNLVPAGWWGSPRASDGSKALRWLLWPSRMRAALAQEGLRGRVARQRALVARGSAPDRGELRELIECGHKDIASAAAGVLMKADAADPLAFAQDEAMFLRLVTADRVTRQAGAAIAASIAFTRLLTLIEEHAKAQKPGPLDVSAVAEIARIAEAGNARDPDSAQVRIALALARIVQDRPAEARALLVNISLERLSHSLRARLLTVRALAEVDLGDVAQARRLVEAARRDDARSLLLGIAQVTIDSAGGRELPGDSARPSPS